MIIWCLLCLFIETSLVLLESTNYVVKSIQFCPLVTLDGNISHYLDSGAYNHQSATSPAECSLLCTVNQAGRCAGFTHNPLTGKCSIHYSLNSGPFSMTSVVLSSPTYPTTYMIFPRRLYYEVHIMDCLFPFTLNGKKYRDSCAVAYECPIGRCNFSMCPTLVQDVIDSPPHADWVICSPFRASLPHSWNMRDIWCLNSTFVINSTQLLPSNWILVQRRSTGSDFNKSWEDYKVGFGVDFHDYWIGNEAFYLLTSMNCSQLFEELPPSTTSTTSKPTFPRINLFKNKSAYYSPAPQSPSSSPPSSLSSQGPVESLNESNILMTTLPPPFEASSGFTKRFLKYEWKLRKLWRLRLEMESREDGKWYSVEYNSVYMDSEEQSYSLRVDHFDAQSSDAGDGFNSSSGLPFVISSTPDGFNEGWWRGCSGSLNAKEAFWPDLRGGFFHPTKTRMFIQPVSKIFKVFTVVWV